MHNQLITPAAGEVRVWLTYYDAIDNSQLPAYRSLLSEDEVHQESRFLFEKDRRRYLITRALARLTLSRYLPIAPTEWRFATNPYGRPTIENPEVRAGHLSFNISHTDSMIVFGVAQGLELGVDVENSDRRKASLAIAARYFAPSEVVQLSALSADEQANRFFEFWTLKESYIKARGMGLSIPLDKFCFDLSTNCIAFTVQQELQDEPERWKFWQFRSNPRYQIAVCAAQSPVLSPHLIVSQTIPLVSEQRIAVKYARESQ